MTDCCLIKKVATVEVYENKNEVRAYGFMAGDRNTPVMEVRFKHLWGESNLSSCKLRWIIVDDVGSLLVGEVPIQSDNTALINLPNELFTGDRRMKVQLTVASCDGERILNLQQFTDLKVINSLAPNEVVEPVYQILINQLYDETQKYLSQLDTLYTSQYGSLENLYVGARASLEQYLITAENGGNAEFLQGYSPVNFIRSENTINELVNSATGKYKVGDTVDLNGYYTAGDGAHHKRKIESADDGSGVQLANGLWANIVHSGTVEAGWFGGNSSSKTDYKNVEIQKSLDYFRDYQNDLTLEFNNLHWVNTNLTCVWSKSDGYRKILKGSIGGEFDNLNEVFFKFGIEMSEYGAISNKRIDINIRVTKDCKAVLKLYTQGQNSLAFWASAFRLQLGCRRGYGLWVANGFFENTIERLRINLMRKHQETDVLKIGNETIGYVLSNEAGENIISSIKHDFINVWGGKHSILATSFSGKYEPDFNADEVHIFDTTNNGLVLNNQRISGCYLNLLHAEFIGRPDGGNYYACFWNGGGTINKIEGGGNSENCGMIGFLNVYNSTGTPFICNSSGKPYSMPFKQNLVSVDVRNGAKFISNGYYFNPNNSGDIVFNQYSEGVLETHRYIATVKNGNINELVDKTRQAFMQSEGVRGRLSGKLYDRLGIKNIFTTTENYENYSPSEYFLRFTPNTSASSPYNRFSFFEKEPIERRKLEAHDVSGAIKVLGNFFLDMGLARELSGSAFLTAYNIESLNTPYHTTKMQQEGVYEDFIEYMDEKTEYDRAQREAENQRQLAFEQSGMENYEEWLAKQPMMLPVENEPQPSEALLKFKEKYLG